MMCLLTVLTVAKYKSIATFKSESKEFTFVVSADESEISGVKSKLENYTYQPVENEMVKEGLYRLTVRCPPDKIGIIKGFILKFSGE